MKKILNFILRDTSIDVVFIIDGNIDHSGTEFSILDLTEEQQLIINDFKAVIDSKLSIEENLLYSVSQIDISQHYSEERLVIFNNITPIPNIIMISELNENELNKYNSCKELAILLIV